MDLNWNTVDELRENFIADYINCNNNYSLETACNLENELKTNYNGRQVLELLQNVDDAFSSNYSNNVDGANVILSLENNILSVINTGTKFTKESIERLCSGHASNKSFENIGNKGTGFRSLLNDSQWIEIHSGEFSIRFSEDFTDKLFKRYIDSSSGYYNERISELLTKWNKDYPLRFPILQCPEKIEKEKFDGSTLIKVKINTSLNNSEMGIRRQLEDSDLYKALLFLPNITSIILNIDGNKKKYKKQLNNDIIHLEQYNGISERLDKSINFIVYKKTICIDKKTVDLIIAVSKDLSYNYEDAPLFCYFPIRDFYTPINALIHAPFLTDASRDGLPNDAKEINKRLFKELFIFIREAAQKLTCKEYISNEENFCP